ncbi:DUF4065 domain-containing protein [Roseburia hominis]|uniref:type II toxin-antitoxin system antitoxin SocA domain-containing protein n=1 Tax=Roseburia hominis TaxID=301301 RepID=UPI001F39848A|nr:DUF4065 domain-containing protein [Roseburia hominis]
MYKALDIAKYVIDKCTRDNCPISNLQLQKILYYIQKAFLNQGKHAFRDDIEAWQFGPVVPVVYRKYCMYGAMPIEENSEIHLNEDDRRIIDTVIVQKRKINPWTLVDDTHKAGGAWDIIYRHGVGNKNKIPDELIQKKG